MQMFQRVSENPTSLNIAEYKSTIPSILEFSQFKVPDFIIYANFCKSINPVLKTTTKTRTDLGQVLLTLKTKSKYFNDSFLKLVIPNTLLNEGSTTGINISRQAFVFEHLLILFDTIVDLLPRLYIDMDYDGFIKLIESKLTTLKGILEFSFEKNKDEDLAKDQISKLEVYIESLKKKNAHLIRKDQNLRKEISNSKKEKYKTPVLLDNRDKYEEFEGSGGDIGLISIYPMEDDFKKKEKVLLNPLRVDHVFGSNEEYFETHFRLIREDFMQAIREGFLLYQEEVRLQKKQKNFNVTIFKNVYVTE